MDGSDDQNTWANKLHRLERPTIEQDGCITFQLERHGGTVNGSTRAHLHTWQVNLTKKTATITRHGHRQLQATKRWDYKTAAHEILAVVEAGQQHQAVSWIKEFTHFQLTLNKVVPGGAQQTVTSRNRRFKEFFIKEAADQGWTCVKMAPRYEFARM